MRGRWARAALHITIVTLGCGRVDFELAEDGGSEHPTVSCDRAGACTRSCVLTSCRASCAPGSECQIRGLRHARLDAECSSGATCCVDADRVEAVTVSCAESSSCSVECRDGTRCEVGCSERAECSLACRSTERCVLACGERAECLLTCDAESSCELGCPADARVDCGGGVVACGRACPA